MFSNTNGNENKYASLVGKKVSDQYKKPITNPFHPDYIQLPNTNSQPSHTTIPRNSNPSLSLAPPCNEKDSSGGKYPVVSSTHQTVSLLKLKKSKSRGLPPTKQPNNEINHILDEFVPDPDPFQENKESETTSHPKEKNHRDPFSKPAPSSSPSLTLEGRIHELFDDPTTRDNTVSMKIWHAFQGIKEAFGKITNVEVEERKIERVSQPSIPLANENAKSTFSLE